MHTHRSHVHGTAVMPDMTSESGVANIPTATALEELCSLCIRPAQAKVQRRCDIIARIRSSSYEGCGAIQSELVSAYPTSEM